MLFKPNKIQNSVVLIAALDWGMGHTTRCVSLIRTLLKAGNRVIFAGNPEQLGFISNDFSEVDTRELEGYGITLDSRKNTYMQMALQQKRIMSAVKRENKWVKSLVENEEVDFIIADNRYGFYHPDVTSVMLTHQINLQVPNFKHIATWLIKRMVEKFDCCWVPDYPERTLTGELSRGELKIPIYFIGPLCRFRKVREKLKYDYLVILSGPEPERTNFLESAKNRANRIAARVAFVGAQVEGHDAFLNPSTDELERLIARSKVVYSRAGYTTIMEMTVLNKKAVLFPTKGQYEQQYLSTLSYPTITFSESFE